MFYNLGVLKIWTPSLSHNEYSWDFKIQRYMGYFYEPSLPKNAFLYHFAQPDILFLLLIFVVLSLSVV